MTKHSDLGAAIGGRVRALREEAGLTQQQLATAVGLTRSSIGNIEAGTQGDLGVPLLMGLAAALDTTVDALLDLQPDQRLAQAEARIARLEDQVRRLVHALNAAGGALQAFGLAAAEPGPKETTSA